MKPFTFFLKAWPEAFLQDPSRDSATFFEARMLISHAAYSQMSAKDGPMDMAPGREANSKGGAVSRADRAPGRLRLSTRSADILRHTREIASKAGTKRMGTLEVFTLLWPYGRWDSSCVPVATGTPHASRCLRNQLHSAFKFDKSKKC